MLNNKMWNIFKKTGSIEAYLYCKKYSDGLMPRENHSIKSQLQAIETTKINSL